MTSRRSIAFVLAAGALLVGRAASADTFAAGSLIIPLDECYQLGQSNAAAWAPTGSTPAIREGWTWDGSTPSSAQCTYQDASSTSSTNGAPYYGTCWAAATNNYGGSSTGIQHAFGVLYLLAKNNIPVTVVNRSDKQALGDPDFGITPSDNGNPVYFLRWNGSSYQARDLVSTGGAAVYYRGAPFIVDAAYAQKAIQVLTSTNAGNSLLSDVTLHVARAEFQAPALAVIAVTPKPLGIVNYSNSNGFNIAVKYLTDAGIIFALTGQTSSAAGEGVAYTSISVNKQGSFSYTWSGAPAAACTNGRCSALTYLNNGVRTRILDVVWAPDINQNTCQDLQPNPSCFDSSGLCQADTCQALGNAAWCCPSANGQPPSSFTSSFNYTNPDGTSTTYYCPCPQASRTGDLCAVADWQYQAATTTPCIAGLGSASQNGCSGATTCDFRAQQCLKNCNSDSQCAAGERCVTASTGPTGCTTGNQDNCPSGYSCTAVSGVNTCVSSQTVCVKQASGINSSVSPACTTSCPSDQYCDPSNNTCQPRWGCEVTCNGCVGGNGGKLSTVWANLTTSTGGFNDLLAAGGTVLGTDTTALTAEASTTTAFLSSAGLGSSSSGSATGAIFCASTETSGSTPVATAGFNTTTSPTYPASNINLQIGDFLYRTLGGNSPAYTAVGAWKNGTINTLAYSTSGSWSYPVVTGQPGTCSTTGTCTTCTVYTGVTCQVDPTKCTTQGAKCGTVVYEGANNFGSSSTSAPLVKLAGQHIVYDTLLQGSGDSPGVGPNPLYPVELSRSAPVANPITAQFYVGTFDWMYTRPQQGSGFEQWAPAQGAYPWTTGHFRSFNPSTSDVNGGFTSANWDLDSWLAGPANGTPPARTIFFVRHSGTTWSLTPFTSANASLVAQQMFNTPSPSATQLATANAVITKVLANHRLGGVDYNTPAVIEQPHGVVSGTGPNNRPTVAYVGARDGMLHAVCVAAKGGTATAPGTCYGGAAPGSELWAVIPPAVLSRMATAVTTNDWSGINVGGAIRVGDVFDFLNPASSTQKVWKTILLVGMRSVGAVAALDISNPDPAGVNGADFRFLWEDSGTGVSPAMGPTLGASIATPNTTGVAVVTAATSGTASGINTYMIRISDGTVLATTTLSYTRSVPSLVSTTPIPTQAPPLATALDTDSDGLDDAVFFTDAQGDVLRLPITTTTFGGYTTPFKIFDASSGCGTSACQPFNASVSVTRRCAQNDSSVSNIACTSANGPNYIVLAASGGTDWADTTSTARYYLYGLDPGVGSTASSPFFQRSLGTLSTPVPFSTSTQAAPLRTYAQPTVTGTDVYIDGTTLSIGSVQQLLNPVLYGGVWGEGVRYGLGSNPSSASITTAQYITPISGAYGGGAGSAVLTNGTVVEVGSSGVFQHALTTAEQATSAPNFNLHIGTTTTRNFKLQSWYQIGE